MILIKARFIFAGYVCRMNYSFQRKAGFALIAFTLLLVFTMIMHPAGGSVEYLIKIKRMIIITHAIAIFSLPFGWIGFWGLTRRLGTDNFWSIFAFGSMSFGLIAVMIAAASNGLIMPLFLDRFNNITPEAIESMRPVLRYSFSINQAFDYIYTGGVCLAILLWSIAIIHTKKLPAWIGWLGIVLAAAAVVLFVTAVAANTLQGFRIFVSSIVLWILIVGIRLTRDDILPHNRVL